MTSSSGCLLRASEAGDRGTQTRPPSTSLGPYGRSATRALDRRRVVENVVPQLTGRRATTSRRHHWTHLESIRIAAVVLFIPLHTH